MEHRLRGFLFLRKRPWKYILNGVKMDTYTCTNQETIDLLGNSLHGISIMHENRTVEFSFEALLENRYLLFARIGEHVFCFDFQSGNAANQWDIIEYTSKYLVTLTIGSFLLNKVWAWLDKGRAIWEKEPHF